MTFCPNTTAAYRHGYEKGETGVSDVAFSSVSSLTVFTKFHLEPDPLKVLPEAFLEVEVPAEFPRGQNSDSIVAY